MLRRLYDWTLSLAARKSAEWWLAIIAFVESSVFLVPADVLFLPMALSRPERAYRYAAIATAASVLGGIAGWMLGYFAYETIAKPVLEFYGKLDEFEALRTSGGFGFILLMLVTSGLAHLPPIKVVTILSGVMHVNLLAVHRLGDHRARRALLLPGLAAAGDMASRSATSSKSASACWHGRGRRPHFALHRRRTICSDAAPRNCTDFA